MVTVLQIVCIVSLVFFGVAVVASIVAHFKGR